MLHLSGLTYVLLKEVKKEPRRVSFTFGSGKGDGKEKKKPVESTKKAVHMHGKTDPIIPKKFKSAVSNIVHSGNGYYGIGIEISRALEVVPYNGNVGRGYVITHVAEGYAADINGILPGDIIIECDGHWFEDSEMYITSPVGKTPIHLTLYRNGRIIELNFTRDWIMTHGKKSN